MGFKKLSSAADTPTTQEDDAGVGADASGTMIEVTAAPPAIPDTTAMPDAIITTDAEGVQRPMSGGSFIRLEDGTLIRNPEA